MSQNMEYKICRWKEDKLEPSKAKSWNEAKSWSLRDKHLNLIRRSDTKEQLLFICDMFERIKRLVDEGATTGGINFKYEWDLTSSCDEAIRIVLGKFFELKWVKSNWPPPPSEPLVNGK